MLYAFQKIVEAAYGKGEATITGRGPPGRMQPSAPLPIFNLLLAMANSFSEKAVDCFRLILYYSPSVGRFRT